MHSLVDGQPPATPRSLTEEEAGSGLGIEDTSFPALDFSTSIVDSSEPATTGSPDSPTKVEPRKMDSLSMSEIVSELRTNYPEPVVGDDIQTGPEESSRNGDDVDFIGLGREDNCDGDSFNTSSLNYSKVEPQLSEFKSAICKRDDIIKRLVTSFHALEQQLEEKSEELKNVQNIATKLEEAKKSADLKLASFSSRLSPEGSELELETDISLNDSQSISMPDPTGENIRTTRTKMEYLQLAPLTEIEGDVLSGADEEYVNFPDLSPNPRKSVLEDMNLQIADLTRKLEANMKYLNEQAAERENERDEFSRKINNLVTGMEELKKDKDRFQKVIDNQKLEIDDCELRLKEASESEQDLLTKADKVDLELKLAVDKIYELREIIRELEDQIDSATQNAGDLKEQNQLLTCEIERLETERKQVVVDMDSSQDTTTTLVSDVTEELHFQVKELAGRLVKKLNELDNFPMCTRPNSSCSGALSVSTEEISVREISCMNREIESTPLQLAEGLRQLEVHFESLVRFEEVVLKKLQDAELQLAHSKKRQEELEIEKPVYLEAMKAQTIKISELENRLDNLRFQPVPNTVTLSGLKARVTSLTETLEEYQGQIELKDIEMKELECKLEASQALLANYSSPKRASPVFRKISSSTQTDNSKKLQQSNSTVQTEQQCLTRKMFEASAQTPTRTTKTQATQKDWNYPLIDLDSLELSNIHGRPAPLHSTPNEIILDSKNKKARYTTPSLESWADKTPSRKAHQGSPEFLRELTQRERIAPGSFHQQLQQMKSISLKSEREEQHDDGFLQVVEVNSEDVISGKVPTNADVAGLSSSQQSVVPGSASPFADANAPHPEDGSQEAGSAGSQGSINGVPSQNNVKRNPSEGSTNLYPDASPSDMSNGRNSPGRSGGQSSSTLDTGGTHQSTHEPQTNGSNSGDSQGGSSPDRAETSRSTEPTNREESRASSSSPPEERSAASSQPEGKRASISSAPQEKRASISSKPEERRGSGSSQADGRRASGFQPEGRRGSGLSLAEGKKASTSSATGERRASSSSPPEGSSTPEGTGALGSSQQGETQDPCLPNENLQGPQGTDWNELQNRQTSRLNEVDTQIQLETCKTHMDQLKLALCNEKKLNEHYKNQINNLMQQLTNGQGGVTNSGAAFLQGQGKPTQQEQRYQDQIRCLREQLARLGGVNQNLQQEHACEKATFDQFYNQVAGLETEYNRLRAEAGEMEKDLENRTKGEQAAQKQLIDLSALVDSQAKEIARFMNENQSLKNDIDQIQAQMRDYMTSAASIPNQNGQSGPGVQQPIASTPKSGAATGEGYDITPGPESGRLLPDNQPPTNSNGFAVPPGIGSAANYKESQLNGTQQQQQQNGYFFSLALPGGDQIARTSPCGTGTSAGPGFAPGVEAPRGSALPANQQFVNSPHVVMQPRGYMSAPPQYGTQGNIQNQPGVPYVSPEGVVYPPNNDDGSIPQYNEYQQNIGIRNQSLERQRPPAGYFFSVALPGENLNNQTSPGVIGRGGGCGSPLGQVGQEIPRGPPANQPYVSPDGVVIPADNGSVPQYNGYQQNIGNQSREQQQQGPGGYFFGVTLPGGDFNNQMTPIGAQGPEIPRGGTQADQVFVSRGDGTVISPANGSIPQYIRPQQNIGNQPSEQQQLGPGGYFLGVTLPGGDLSNEMIGTQGLEIPRGTQADQVFVNPDGTVISPANGSIPQYILPQQNRGNQPCEQQQQGSGGYFLGVTLPGGDLRNEMIGTQGPEIPRGTQADQAFVSPDGRIISPANGSIPQYIRSQENSGNQSRGQHGPNGYFLSLALPGGGINNQFSGGGC